MSDEPQVTRVVDLVSYQDGAIVSRIVVKRETGNVTLFAFAAGQELSEHTALIAVDPMPARPAQARLVSASVPLNLPAGWRYESVFGDASLTRTIRSKLHDQEAALALPATALGIDERVLTGLMLLLAAAALVIAFRAPERRAAA